jgi:hypothetical protein
MTRLTLTQLAGLDNMNVNSQRAGGIGTRIDTLEYGGISTPDVGTITPITFIEYAVTPVIGTATYVHAAYTLGATGATVTTGITDPDVPRIATIKGNATMSGDVVINGTNIDDEDVSDTIALNNSSEVLGDVAFKTITSIEFCARTNGSGDTCSVGIGNKIGLPVAVPNASVVLAKSFDSVADGGTVTTGATVEASIFAPAGTMNGTHVVSLVIAV